jgi:hypothetical protein
MSLVLKFSNMLFILNSLLVYDCSRALSYAESYFLRGEHDSGYFIQKRKKD